MLIYSDIMFHFIEIQFFTMLIKLDLFNILT